MSKGRKAMRLILEKIYLLRFSYVWRFEHRIPKGIESHIGNLTVSRMGPGNQHYVASARSFSANGSKTLKLHVTHTLFFSLRANMSSVALSCNPPVFDTEHMT